MPVIFVTMLELLYNDIRWKEYLSKQEPADLQDDLQQFVMVELQAWLTKTGYQGDLFPIAVGIVRNQLHSTRSKFYRLYRRKQQAGIAITEPDDHYNAQMAVVRCILEGKPVHESLGHRNVTLPMKSLRYQADHHHSMQTGIFKRTTAVVNVPIVISTDAADMDAVNDLLDALQAIFNKQLGSMATPDTCICEVGSIYLHDIKFPQ